MTFSLNQVTGLGLGLWECFGLLSLDLMQLDRALKALILVAFCFLGFLAVWFVNDVF